MSSAAYYFLPWARQGVLAGLSTPDTLGGGGPTRASIPVKLRLTGRSSGSSTVTNEITMPLRLYGPGDVIGIDPREIVRTEPRHLTPDFPSHLLAAIEFDRPDFPWLFTPAAPNGDKMRPWIVLVVVEKRKATVTADPNSPLPMLTCPIGELPDLKESWLWAHAQFVGGANETNLPASLAAAPARTVSRLLCPRRLQPSSGTHSGYLACLTAAFDVGRKAGLGRPISAEDEKNLAYAWDVATQTGNVDLPVYYSWEFSTAANEGDFEELVDKLQMPGASAAPRAAVMDLSQADRELPLLPGARLGLLSALRPPGVVIPDWPSSLSTTFEQFQQKIQQILETAPSSGQRVPPPAYGSQQAGTGTGATSSALGPSAPAWLRDLNRNPRYRVAAALGAQVVQQQQEQFVASAWRQAGELADANRWLIQKQLAREVSRSVFEKRLKVLTPGSFQQITAPVAAPSAPAPAATRLTTSAFAAASIEAPAPAPAEPLLEAVVSAPFRRIARPQSPLARRPTLAVAAGQPAPRIQETLGPLLTKVADAPSLVETQVALAPSPVETATFSVEQPTRLTASFAIAPTVSTSSTDLLARLDPNVTYALEAQARLQTSDAVAAPAPGAEPLAQLRLTPTFPQPMYEPLRDLFRDMLLPGLDAIPNNSIMLLGTEAAFIEAYMVGLNDELGRELLWREFPTNLRGTYFRQFWDARSQLGPEPTAADRERLTDIPPIAGWDKPLGSNLKPERGRNLVILLIKGDLLVRFPTTLIFAARARWSQGSGGTAVAPAVVDDAQPPVLPSLQVDPTPGVRLLGFNIPGGSTAAVGWATPGSVTPPQDPGWYFVIQEHPTEPRFGFNISRVDPLSTWRKLAWTDVGLRSGGAYVAAAGKVPALTGTPSEQDKAAVWGRTAADMAYIALQKAYRLEVHAGHWLL